MIVEKAIASYQVHLKQWMEFHGDKDIGKNFVQENYEASCLVKYLTFRKDLAEDKQLLSPKMLRNIWLI